MTVETLQEVREERDSLRHELDRLRAALGERVHSAKLLDRIVGSARCLLWYADIEVHGDSLEWRRHAAGEEAAQRFLPMPRVPEQSYHEVLRQRTVAEDRERIDAIVEKEVRAARDYSVEFRSPAYDRIWGRSSALLTNENIPWVEGVHPDDQRSVSEARLKLPENVETEYRVVRPNGDIRWVHDRGFAIRGTGGAASGWKAPREKAPGFTSLFPRNRHGAKSAQVHRVVMQNE